MFDVERIKYQAKWALAAAAALVSQSVSCHLQVTNGKNAMPAFGERLGPEDIEAPTAPRTRFLPTRATAILNATHLGGRRQLCY